MKILLVLKYDNEAIFLLFIQEIQASTSRASLLPVSDGFGYSSFTISKGIYQCMYQKMYLLVLHL